MFVEGPLDVAAVASLEREDLVPLAPCGTALTEEQLELVRTAGGDLGHAVFLFDSDTSGREATVRAWERLTPREAASAAGARLPGVKDPGELVEVGRAEELNRALRYPGPLTYDVIDHVVASNTHGDVTPALAVALARRLAGAVTRLPEDPDTRGYLAAVLSRHLAEETVREILAEARTPAPSMAEDASTADAPTRELAPRAPFVNGDVQVWLERQADLISDRLDALVADVEGPTPPLWARRLYRPPPDAKTLAVWRASVRDVAAYRDRYAITGTDPLGPDSDRDAGVQERAHRVAAAALSRITPPPTSGPSTADDSALDALHRRRGLARTQAARALEAARRTHEQTTRTRPTERPIYPQDPHPSGPEIGV
ncbi:toprim domain-containing protein [Miniimonas sp. S16]|uniref:toprim domain-containing protein n=1 Tax=Miniimonas sp. S16 TaxID=2171623 RepID=UPI00131F03BC|nr:toprim domain-containing protein [Miniimonas sp. S16]